MCPAIILSVLFLLLGPSLCAPDLASLSTRHQPLRTPVHHHHDLHVQSKKNKGSASNGKVRHGEKSKDSAWNQHDSGSHSHSDEDVKKKKEGGHWNNFGETETVVKDKGHGYVKSFSWDREEVKKDKWGKKGGHYNEGYEKKQRKDKAKHRKGSSGRHKSNSEHKEADRGVWVADDAEDVYAGLTWQDLQALQGLI